MTTALTILGTIGAVLMVIAGARMWEREVERRRRQEQLRRMQQRSARHTR